MTLWKNYELLLRYAYLSTVHYITVFLKARTYTLYITTILKYIMLYSFYLLNLPMMMSWLNYYFFTFSTHHQPVAVNLVHLTIIISALVCFLYYQLQYCLHRILEFFLSSDLANVGKWKLFVKKLFVFGVADTKRFIFKVILFSWPSQYLKNKRSAYECICDFPLQDCHCLYLLFKIWPRGCLTSIQSDQQI